MDCILLGELGLGCGSFGPGIRKEEFSDISRNGLLASCYYMVGGEEGAEVDNDLCSLLTNE